VGRGGGTGKGTEGGARSGTLFQGTGWVEETERGRQDLANNLCQKKESKEGVTLRRGRK